MLENKILLDMLIDTYAEFHSPSEHLAVDKVIVLFKGRVVFKQYVPKKHKCFCIKIYELCIVIGYTYDMSIYLGNDWQNATQIITVTHKCGKSH
jgi:hypothetical protein